MRKMLLTAVAAAPLIALGACAGPFEETAAVETPAATTEATGRDAAWSFWDTDRDGVLTRDEYDVIGTDFTRVDADASGVIEEDEYGAWATETWGAEDDAQAAGLFDEWDDDDDLALTEDEWADDEAFFLWDEDASGALEDDEGWL